MKNRSKVSRFFEKIWDFTILVFRLRKQKYDEQIQRLCVISVIGVMILVESQDFLFKFLDCIEKDSWERIYSFSAFGNYYYFLHSSFVILLYFITGKFIFSLNVWIAGSFAYSIYSMIHFDLGVFQSQPMQILPATIALLLLFGKVFHSTVYAVVLALLIIACITKDYYVINLSLINRYFENYDYLMEQVIMKNFSQLMLFGIYFAVLLVYVIDSRKVQKVLAQLEKALEIYDFDHITIYEKIRKKNVKFLTRFESVMKKVVDELKEMSTFVSQNVKEEKRARLESSDDSSTISSYVRESPHHSINNRHRHSSGGSLPNSDTSSCHTRSTVAGGGICEKDVVFLLVFLLNEDVECETRESLVLNQLKLVDCAFQTAQEFGGAISRTDPNRVYITFNDVRIRPEAGMDAVKCFRKMQKVLEPSKKDNANAAATLGAIVMKREQLCGMVKSNFRSSYYHFSRCFHDMERILDTHITWFLSNARINTSNSCPSKKGNSRPHLPILINGELNEELKYEFMTKQIDLIVWDKPKCLSSLFHDIQTPTSVFKIVKRRDLDHKKEWMYTIETVLEDEKVDENVTLEINSEKYLSVYQGAWGHYCRKDFSKSREMISDLMNVDGNDFDVQNLLRKVENSMKEK